MKNKKVESGWISILLMVVIVFGLFSCSEEEESVISVKAPEVSAVYPTDSSTDVGLTGNISVTFDESMDPVTILINTTDTTCSEAIQVSADDFQTCLILSSSSFSSYPYQTFTFQATAGLTALTTYKIKVTQQAKDVAGDSLAAEYVMSTGFTTTAGGSAPGVSMSFFDRDMREDVIEGELNMTRATDESAVDEYRLYWGSSSTEKLSSGSLINSVTSDGTDKTFSIGSSTTIPTGVTHLLIFTVFDGTESTTSTALDIPDGIVEMVKDINGSAGTGSDPDRFTDMNGILYFFADSTDSDFGLWRSDGTDIGTYRLDVSNPTNNGSISNIHTAVIGNTLFFSSAEGAPTNYELWKSDGTDTGTDLLHEISTGLTGSNPQLFTVMGNSLFFKANDGTDKLFGTDGTTLTDVTSTFPASVMTAVGTTLFFNAYRAAEGTELWKSDGNAGNAMLVKDINSGGDSYLDHMIEFNSELFFKAYDGSTNGGEELWKSDGTETGTIRLKDINPGSESSFPKNFKEFNGQLFFTAKSASTSKELWKTDGTDLGTTQIKTISTDSMAFDPKDLTVAGDSLFFVAQDVSSNTELWRSDGTDPGTSMIDIQVTDGSDPAGLTAVGDKMFFFANGDTYGAELWASDGTVAGTMLLIDINPAGDGVDLFIPSMMLVGENLFFSADNGSDGKELWRYFVK